MENLAALSALREATGTPIAGSESHGTADLSISPHDCTGPVTWVANLHLALALPNALWLESVRAYWRGFYPRLVTALPEIVQGEAYAMSGTGLGTEFSQELLMHPDTVIERSIL